MQITRPPKAPVKKPKPDHFVVADTHFGYDRIAQERGWDSAASFEKDFVSGYLSAVQEHQVVWFLGDIFGGNKPSDLLVDLPGTKHLILGNHDTFTHDQYLAAGFSSVRAMAFSARTGVVLTHYPVHPHYFSHRQERWINLHGHLHTEIIPDQRYRNCCIDQFSVPKTIEQLILNQHPGKTGANT